MNKSNQLYIGLLSGTSMDAMDCALVDFSNTAPQLLATHSVTMPISFKEKCLHITQTGECSLDVYGMLDAEAGELFATAVLELLTKHNIDAKNICAIGSHGQTIRHRPDLYPPFTLQIGNPHIIAERTKITVVADVRKRDMAAGGQGAPLAPGFHENVFRDPKEDRVILNMGGISNISIIKSDASAELLGYDTGPGNGLLDAWVSKVKNVSYDQDGAFAAAGKIMEPLLSELLNDPYFALSHPKSTGREYFNLLWLENHLQKVGLFNELALNLRSCLAADIQATLIELTTRTIAKEILMHAPTAAVYVCGGGIKNPILMQSLAKNLQKNVQTTKMLGVDPDWVEAMLFAWIAKQTMERKTSNYPSVTGARHAVSLGGVFYG